MFILLRNHLSTIQIANSPNWRLPLPSHFLRNTPPWHPMQSCWLAVPGAGCAARSPTKPSRRSQEFQCSFTACAPFSPPKWCMALSSFAAMMPSSPPSKPPSNPGCPLLFLFAGHAEEKNAETPFSTGYWPVPTTPNWSLSTTAPAPS